MSFGPSQQEKNQLSTLQGQNATLQDLSGTSTGREGKTFRQFEKSLTPVLDYWRAILSGDPVASSGAVAPTATAVGEQYDAVEKGVTAQMPRGVSGSARAELETKKAGDISSLIEKLQPEAAGQLASLAGLLSGTSTGFGQLATGQLTGAQSGTEASLNIMNQWRQQQMQFWGDIIGGALGAGGAIAGAKIGCWIAMALYGDTDPRVNVLRYFIFHVWSKRSIVGSVFARLYLRFGERVAVRVKRGRIMRTGFKLLFDALLNKAKQEMA